MKKHKQQILDMFEQYKTSEEYSMIVERAEFIVMIAKNKEHMLKVIKENSTIYYKNEPSEMLNYLNFLIHISANSSKM